MGAVQGAQGPQGPQGAQGPPGERGAKGKAGPPPTTAFGLVRADGALVAGKGITHGSLETNAVGGPVYSIGFAQDLKACAIGLSVVNTSQSLAYESIPRGSPAARWLVDYANPVDGVAVKSAIMVRVWDGGAGVERPFQVTVMC